MPDPPTPTDRLRTPPEDVLRALADPERLAIAGALAGGPRSARGLAEDLALPLARVRRHLGRLASTGIALLDGDCRTYRLQPETLREAAKDVGPSREAGLALGAVDPDEEAVLRSYFRGGRLVEIPARRSRRRIVLTRLALEFEVGVRYPEGVVNEVLHRFHDDHASLRRYLVDEGLLSRERGRYWRSGGPVDV